jgi:hypothetical protein
MASTNVIQFAPALQRRRERQGDGGVSADGRDPWAGHHPAGVDGLWLGEPQATGTVIPFARP